MVSEGRRSNLHQNPHCVPAWEREFTEKIGGFAWERFVMAKKRVYSNTKIMEWDDSAAEKAFLDAKNRFWCEYNYLRSDEFLYDSYVYIDNNLDWHSRIQEHEEDKNLMLVSKEEFSRNGGTNHGILKLMLHPVANVKRYAKKKWLSGARALSDMSVSN